MRVLFVLFICFIYPCCNGKQNTNVSEGDKQNFFSDIDYFRMAGVGSLDKENLKYPCFHIDSVNDKQRNIFYLQSAQEKSNRQYFRKNGYWVSSYITQGDTSSLTTYNYILDNKKILWLDYENDINDNPMKIYSLTIFENNTEVTYNFKESLEIEPTTNVDELLKNQLSYKTTSNYSINNGVLKVMKEEVNLLDMTISKDSNTYNIGSHSIFWWYHFR